MHSRESDRIRREGLGVLCVLPDPLLSVLTFYLDVRSVCKLACCSKFLRVFAYEPCLWMHHALTGHDGPLSYQANWRQTALSLLYQAASVASTGWSAKELGRSTDTLSKQQFLDHLAAAVAAAAAPLPPVQGLQSDFLYRRWYRSHVALSGFVPLVDQVPRVHHGTLTAESFTRLYDRPAQPVILTGFMDAELPAGWQQHWQVDSLSARYSTAVLRASRPAGGKTSMRLSDYIDYMSRQVDEEPLYVFDEEFGEVVPDMLQWYKPPSVISEDLTSVLDHSVRPDHRWLVLGPAAAGASWHVDPALTSAWNSLTSGLKRWALYPPHVTPPGLGDLQHQHQQQCRTAGGNSHYEGGSAERQSSSSSSSSWCTVTCSEDEEEDLLSSWSSSSSSSSGGVESAGSGLTSLQWYLEVYPHLQPHQRPYEFTQHPGETVFIPGGWWHLVLNLEPSVAVTENLVTQANFKRVVGQLALGSRVYEKDVLGFYEEGSRPWVGDWQQHQRQQWLMWHQHQQQLQQGDGCTDVAGAAVSLTATSAAADHQTAAVSPSTQETIATGTDRPLCTCWTVHESPYSHNIAAANIRCFTRAAADRHACEGGHVACLDSGPSWEHVLQCINGHRGYRRSRMLGPWLKQLWNHQQQHRANSISSCDTPQQQQQQQLRQQITAVANKYLGHQEWRQLVHAISEAHGSCSSSSSVEVDGPCFPAVGSDSLVFSIGPAVVKLLVDQAEVPAQLAATVEVRLMHALQQQRQQQQQSVDIGAVSAASVAAGTQSGGQRQGQTSSCMKSSQGQQQQQQQQQEALMLSTPDLIGYGTICFVGSSTSNSSSSKGGVKCCVPYVVMSQVAECVTAADVADQLSQQHLQQLAVACGKFLAQMHSLPLDLAPENIKGNNSQTRPSAARCAGGKLAAAASCCCTSSAGASSNSRPAAAAPPQQQQQAKVLIVDDPGKQLLLGSVWRSRDGTIWSSQFGCLAHQQQQQQLLKHAASNAAAAAAAADLDALQLGSALEDVSLPPAAGIIPQAAAAGVSATRGVAHVAAVGHDSSDSIQSQPLAEGVGVRSAWWPFVQFLQQRRAELLQQLAAEMADLLRSGTVAAEVYRHFPAAADQLAAAEMQRQQQTQRACGVAHSSNSSNTLMAVTTSFPVIGVGEECLPSWLMQQVEEYMPEDMNQLIHCTSVATTTTTTRAADAHAAQHQHTPSCTSGGTGQDADDHDSAQSMGHNNSSSSSRRLDGTRQPVWLHGDLMAGNLLLTFKAQQQPAQQQQQQKQGGANGNYSSHAAVGSDSSTSQQPQSSRNNPARPLCSSKQQAASPSSSDQPLLSELEGVTVIDMSDGGVGDPLYDFVAVFVSVLHCDVELLKLAIESYHRHPRKCVNSSKASAVRCVGVQHQQMPDGHCITPNLEMQPSCDSTLTDTCVDGTPAKQYAGCSPSKAFLVYLLLHEEGVMGQLLQQHPHLRCAGSLDVLQQRLFGWLDGYWT